MTNLPPAAKESTHIVSRLVVIGLVGLLTLAAVFIGVRWAWYRYDHVVISGAIVRGTVTRIGARIDGRVASIEVESGQRVAKGDVLLRMEDRQARAELDQARADLQSATKDLECEKLEIEQSRRGLALEIERVNAERKKAANNLTAVQSTLTKVEAYYQSTAALLKRGAVSTNDTVKTTADRDNALALVNAAAAAAEAAEFNYQKAMNDLEGIRVREARLGVMEWKIATARAKAASAEADLDDTVIRAPEDGWVLERTVEVGGSAKVGAPMLALWIGRPWVEAWVDEGDVRKMKVGSPVEVSLDVDPRRKLAGRIDAIGLVTDKQLQAVTVSTTRGLVEQSAMVPIQIALEEEDSRLQLGGSAIVGIKKDSEEQTKESVRASRTQTPPTPTLRHELTRVALPQ